MPRYNQAGEGMCDLISPYRGKDKRAANQCDDEGDTGPTSARAFAGPLHLDDACNCTETQCSQTHI
jgi:hypothetical protein